MSLDVQPRLLFANRRLYIYAEIISASHLTTSLSFNHDRILLRHLAYPFSGPPSCFLHSYYYHYQKEFVSPANCNQNRVQLDIVEAVCRQCQTVDCLRMSQCTGTNGNRVCIYIYLCVCSCVIIPRAGTCSRHCRNTACAGACCHGGVATTDVIVGTLLMCIQPSRCVTML